MEFINPEGLRVDGRRPPELRQLKCDLGVVEGADGSASFQMGHTKVLAAVYGPRMVKNRSDALHDKVLIRCEYSMAPFSTGERRRRGKGDRRSTEIALVIRQTFEAAILRHLMPFSEIDIYAEVVQADGGTRCACINAISLALAEAGIPMQDLVASCAAGYLDGAPLVDLNHVEDSGGGPDLVVGLMPQLNKILLLQMDSKLPMETYEKVLDLAIQGCQTVGKHMREAILTHTKRLAAARG